MKREEVIQRQIDEIMDNFDFDLVHKIFSQNNWHYVEKDGTGIPEVPSLRKFARGLLVQASKYTIDGTSFVSSGRLRATICNYDNKISLELLFVPEDYDCEPTAISPSVC
jgi:hypothetical protein